MGTTTITIPERGVCSVCGKTAYDPRSTKCEEHRTVRKTTRPRVTHQTTSTVAPDFKVETPKTDGKTDRVITTPTAPLPADDPKVVKALVYEKQLREQVNPLLVQGFAFLCRPLPSENFFTVTTDSKNNPVMNITTFGQAVQLNDMECKVLSRSLVELEDSPLVNMASGTVKPFLPVVWAVAGIGVVAFHGYNMMNLRDGMLRNYNEQMQANATPNQPVAPTPAPTATTEEGEPSNVFDLPNVGGAR